MTPARPPSRTRRPRPVPKPKPRAKARAGRPPARASGAYSFKTASRPFPWGFFTLWALAWIMMARLAPGHLDLGETSPGALGFVVGFPVAALAWVLRALAGVPGRALRERKGRA